MKSNQGRRKCSDNLRSVQQNGVPGVIDLIQTGVYIADKKGDLAFVNKAFAEIFHYDDKSKMVGVNLADELYERRDDRFSFLKVLQEKGSVNNYQIRMIRKDGSKVVVSARSNMLKDNQGEYVGVEGVLSHVREERDAADVSQVKPEGETSEWDIYEKIESLTKDAITGTFNYQYFVTRLDYEIKRATLFSRPLCLMMIDIDDFSVYNGEFGYPQGNALLKHIGAILRENLRDADILCRQSQDQFFVLLPEAKQEDALAMAKKLKDAVQHNVFQKAVTCSMGISRYVPGMTRQEILLRVNTGLCMAKQMGKNEACLYGL